MSLRFPKPTKPKKRRSSRKDPKHLALVRSCGCCVPGCTTGLAIHCHHVRTAANSGMGLKPADTETVPLCALHHHELHQIGAPAFEAKYRIRLAKIAAELALRPPPDLL